MEMEYLNYLFDNAVEQQHGLDEQGRFTISLRNANGKWHMVTFDSDNYYVTEAE